MTYQNEITTLKAYDTKGSLNNLSIGSLKQLSYSRDNVGNITSIIDALDSTKTKTFAYDALYRLTQAVGQWGTLQYQYDSVGNRTTETSSSGTTNYTYSANKLTLSTGTKAFSFAYDNNDNTTVENNRQYIYNQNQRLIKAVENGSTLGEYTYNGNGQRVKKVASDRTTYFIYDQSGNLIEEADENGQVNIDYIYLGSVPVARVDEWWEGMTLPDTPTGLTVTPADKQLTINWTANAKPVDGYKVYWGTTSDNYSEFIDVGKTTSYTITGLTNGTTYYITVTAYADIKETYFYHTDHLGTPIMMTNSSGTIVWEGELQPFGERNLIKGSITNNLGFPGQYYDTETGQYYNWWRYYNAEIGRYHEKDPIRFKGGINPYSYVTNPVNWIDRWGLKPGDKYQTQDAAATTALDDIIKTSISEDLEYAGWIYKNTDKCTYSYTNPNKGTAHSSDPGSKPSNGTAAYHTHGAESGPEWDDENLSIDDKDFADYYKVDIYLRTPSGKQLKYP